MAQLSIGALFCMAATFIVVCRIRAAQARAPQSLARVARNRQFRPIRAEDRDYFEVCRDPFPVDVRQTSLSERQQFVFFYGHVPPIEFCEPVHRAGNAAEVTKSGSS
jgi:hypothetical protein